MTATSNARPAAILFDLDDTLLDDSGNVESGWRLAVSAHAAAAGVDPEALLASIAEVRDWYWSDPDRSRTGRLDLRAASAAIVAGALERIGQNDAGLAKRVADLYRDIRLQGQALMPGAIGVLDTLREQGVRLALLTNGDGPAQRQKIDRFDLGHHFDYICIEGEFGCGKPDERVYRGALDALTCEASSAWMVGDNLLLDVAAPMQLGIAGIWFDRSRAGLATSPTTSLYRDLEVRPDRVIHSLTELLTPGS